MKHRLLVSALAALVAGGFYTAVGNIHLDFQFSPGAAPPPPSSGASDTGLALIGVGTIAIALGVIAVART